MLHSPQHEPFAISPPEQLNSFLPTNRPLTTMKSFALACLLLVTAAIATSDAVTVRTHHKHHESNGDVKTVTLSAHHKHHDQFKSSPWDSEADVKKQKCEDLCYLSGFWQHQLGRNCNSRPTDLCMQYKLANAGLDMVLVVAECDCNVAAGNSTSH